MKKKPQTDQWKKAFKNSFPVIYCDKLIKNKIEHMRYTIRLTCTNKQGERNHLYSNITNYHLNKNLFSL